MGRRLSYTRGVSESARSGVRKATDAPEAARPRVDSAELAAAVRRLLWPAVRRAVGLGVSFVAGAGSGYVVAGPEHAQPAAAAAAPSSGSSTPAAMECRLLLEWADVFADKLGVPEADRPRPGPPPAP